MLLKVINISKVTEYALITHWVTQMTHFSHEIIYTMLYSSRDGHALTLITSTDITS